MPFGLESPAPPFNDNFHLLHVRQFNLDSLAIMSQVNGAVFERVLTADFVHNDPSCFRLRAPGGADAAIEVGEGLAVGGDQDPYKVGQPGASQPLVTSWTTRTVVDAIVDLNSFANGTPEMATGIELGIMGDVAIPASPTNALAALYMTGFNNPALRWELTIARGNGTTRRTITLAGVTVPFGTGTFHLRMIYQPGEYVAGFVDGVLGGAIVDQTRFPTATGAGTGLGGSHVFMFGGPHAAAAFNVLWYDVTTTRLR